MNIYLSIFVPLQGFFNWLIFMRPRLKRSSACAIAASASSSCSLIGVFLSRIFCACRTEASEDCYLEDRDEHEEEEKMSDSSPPATDEENGNTYEADSFQENTDRLGQTEGSVESMSSFLEAAIEDCFLSIDVDYQNSEDDDECEEEGKALESSPGET
eukprot:CAMPEP_0194203340 /NCGR_PEP_ID=MMETSP0156-20130528/3153_1 /TAXON_ID=33649 /ORGANISM="Thalassionema nitzschioides, Strain L26-B" /LENGTH=157 /DNA_ID=CAMNT_0038929079 /DNA_START=1051 /DNA_END=1524 /DNA_ORIENTATION=-